MKRSISLLLLALLITSWLGTAMWRGDPSGDGRIDLQDAVLLMKDFTQTAQDPQAFEASIEKLLSTLRLAAGLETVIKSAKHGQPESTLSSPTLPYLPSAYNALLPPDIGYEVGEIPLCCESADRDLFSPPPRAA
jgi:hypothetical protein